MELTLNISAIVAIIGALTVLTNIIVEVLKRATWEKMPTNLLAIIVAMVLTLVAFFGYMAFMATPSCGITWPPPLWWASRWPTLPCSASTS